MKQLLYRIKWLLLQAVLLFASGAIRAQTIPSESVTISRWPYTVVVRDTNDIPDILNRYSKQSNDSTAELYLYLIRKSKELNYEWGIVICLGALASNYVNTGQFSKALQTANNALEKCHPGIRDDKERLPVQLSLYRNIGVAYAESGYYEKAMEYYQKVVSMANSSPELKKMTLSIYNDIATVLPDRNMAISYFDKCYELAKEFGDTRMMGMALQNKSITYEARGISDTAAQLIAASYELAQQYKDTFLEYTAFKLWSLNYINQDKKEKAKEYLLKADALIGRFNLGFYQVNAHYKLMGEIYFKLKDFKKGEYYLLRAADTARMYKMNYLLADVNRSLSLLYNDWGKHNKAFDHAMKYSKYKDSIVNEKIAQNIHLLEIQYRTAEKDKELVDKERQLEKKNYFIAGTLLVLICLTGILYFTQRNFRQKQRLLLRDKEIEKLKAAIQGEEQERIRIARELHDGIMVQFSSVKMNLSSMASRSTNNKSQTELTEVIDDLDKATRELRRSAHNLLPDMLLAEGLKGAIIYFCNSIQKSTSATIEFQSYGNLPTLKQEYELMLYRIIQELVQNALKHAQAKHIIVQLDATEALLSVTVEDDGIGFDAQESLQKEGFGLKEIKRRIESIDGIVEINSESQMGTTVYIEIEISNLQLIQENTNRTL